MEVYTGKIFQSGGSQAIRIPKECSFSKDVKEVYIINQSNDKKLLIQKKKSLVDFYHLYSAAKKDTDFLKNREDTPPVDKELF